MKELKNNVGLETRAVGVLIDKMMKKGTTYEELEKVLAYMIGAAIADDATLKLRELSDKTGIREICEKYIGPDNKPNPEVLYAGRYPWENIKKDSNDILIYREDTMKVKTTDVKVGDKILVELTGIGVFTATAHKVTDKEVLFIMDEYITSKPMDGLQEWLDTVVYDAFPDDLKKKIKNITIPSVGQVFGWEDEWCKEVFERDSDEQLPLMKQRRNRVAYLDNEIECGWLRNRTKSEVSSASFARVNLIGGAYYLNASNSYGVRPEFTLVK